MRKRNLHNLSKSDVIAEIPLACSDETAAVEFFEFQRWGENRAVYAMKDAKTESGAVSLALP